MFHPLLSKLTCCVFFLLPGLFYGLVMSRLPAGRAAAGLCFIGFSSSVIAVLIGFAAMGIGISMLDVAMNTQGVLYEFHSRSQSMNLFHAFYSLGAVLASLIGSVCATARLTAGLNFVIASAPFLLLSLALN